MGPVMSSRPVRHTPGSAGVEGHSSLPLQKIWSVGAVVATLLLCLASRLLASLRGQRKGCQHNAIRRGCGEHYLTTRGSSDDDRLPALRLHHVHRPGDGTSGSKGNFGSARSAFFSLRFARPSRAVIPPKPRSGWRRRRKGVDGEDLGRGTIGLAMIGCDHA